MLKDFVLWRGAGNRASRTRYRSERGSSRMSFPRMEGESCRSRLGDALSPGKDFKFHTFAASPRDLAATLRRTYVRHFRLRRADRPATFEFWP